MQVTNVTSRLIHVGDVMIAPGETKAIDPAFATAINKADLVPVEDEAPKRGRAARAEAESASE